MQTEWSAAAGARSDAADRAQADDGSVFGMVKVALGKGAGMLHALGRKARAQYNA